MDNTTLGAGVPDFGIMVLKGSGALLVVLAFLVLTLYLLRRMGTFRGSVGRRLRILEILQVGTRERVVLVAMRDRELLLGVTASSIHTLAEFSREEDLEKATTVVETAPEPIQKSFGAFLAGALKGKKKGMHPLETGDGN